MLFGEIVTPVTVLMRRCPMMMSGGLVVGRGGEMVFTRWMGRGCWHLHPLFLEVSPRRRATKNGPNRMHPGTMQCRVRSDRERQ
jgi:hypothetical protein